MSRVVRTLLISDKSPIHALTRAQHPAIDRNSVDVSLRGNNLLVKILGLMGISDQTDAIGLDVLQTLATLEKENSSSFRRVPITVHLILPFFISKARLLSDIKLATDSLGLARICVDNLERSVFLAAALPELEVVWVARSKNDFKDLASAYDRSGKFEVLVEVDESLLDSKSIVSNLLDCFIHVIATKVRTPERALELRTWSVSEITSPHITVLNIL